MLHAINMMLEMFACDVREITYLCTMRATLLPYTRKKYDGRNVDQSIEK